MANNQYRLFQSVSVLKSGRIFLCVLLCLFGVSVYAQDTVFRYSAASPSTSNASGTDIYQVQTASGAALNDVFKLTGTASQNTGLDIRGASLNFTIQSDTPGVTRTIKKTGGNGRFYNFNEASGTNAAMTLKDLSIQGSDSVITNAIGLFLHNSTTNSRYDVTIDNVAFSGFKNGNYKGAVFAFDRGDLYMTVSNGLTFDANRTNAAYGGAIDMENSGKLVITGDSIIFNNNYAKSYGGAIHGSNTTITGNIVKFTNNTADTELGGAVNLYNGTLTIKGQGDNPVIEISGNKAAKLGGAIRGNSAFSNGAYTFANNTAGTDGGAIYCDSVTFSGDNTSAVFTGNTAAGTGNDLYVNGASGTVLSFTDSGSYSFDGGIHLANEGVQTVINKAQVTIAGRANDTTNIYQLKNTTISNGGKLTANLDNINSFTGAFNLGSSSTDGMLELNVGAGLAKEISFSDVSVSGDGTLAKSGSGTLTLSGSNDYVGNVTVSGGTLVVPSTTALGTYNVTVESGATFKSGADLDFTEIVLNGGSYVVGDTSESSEVSIGYLTLDGGRICFDFNASGGVDADWLMVSSSATLNSGYIDLSFNGSSADEWWDFIHTDYSSGFSIIQGSIVDYDQFNPENVKVTINGQPTNSWELEAQSGQLLLHAVEGEDPQVDPWYDANTSDIDLPNWTITGTDRVGAKFTDGGADAEYSGEVNMNGNGSFDVAENKNLTLSGVVSGSGSVTKTGAGTLTLSNAPGWTGNTTVNAGTLQLGADSTLNNLSGTNAEGVHGTVDYGATNLTLNNTADTEFAGVISGSGSVAKTGANTLTLSGSNTYTGATTVSAGELVFSGSSLPVSAMTTTGGTLVLGSAGNTIVAPNGSSFKISSGNIRVDGNVEINSGTVTVKGDWTGNGDIKVNSGSQLRVTTNLSYDKGITLNGGTFRNATDGRTVTVNAPINVTANSYLQAGWSETVTLNGALKGSGNITIPDDSGWVIFAGNGSNYTGSLLVQGKMRVGASGTDVSDSKALIGSKEITFNGGTIQNSNNNLTITNDINLSSESYFKAGWSKKLTLTGAITGSGKFHVLSDSGWVIAATTCTDNSFTGSVHTDNDSNPYGLLRLGADNPFGANAGEARIWGTLDMNGYSQTFAGVANSDSTSSGTVRGTSSSVLTLKLNNSANKVFGGKIENGLNLVLTGDGTGVQTLKQAPAYTGYTRIEAGTLILSSGGTLYNLSGNALGTVNNNGKAITLNNSSTSEFAGVIKGAGSLTKTGAGKLTLSGANAYTGATTVSEGTLVLASSGSLTSNVTVASGAAFVDSASSITSNVTINGGTFSIGDTSAASRITIGDFALTSGTVNFDFNSASTADNYDFLTTGAATLTSGSVNVLFNNGDETTWWDNVSDSGYVLISSTAMTADLTNVALLINNNAGTENWYLDQTDNALVLKKAGGVGPTPGDETWYYANTNDINEPSWTIDGTNKLGVKFKEGGSSATFNGGVALNSSGEFEIGSGRSLTVSNVISGEGALTKTGEGTLELSGDNTFTGGTNISQGTVKVSNVNGLGTGLVTLNGGTLDTTGSAMAFANSIKVDENGGTITVQDGGDYTSFSSISGSGDLSTNGRVEFRGSGGYNGHLTVASGYARVTPGAFGVFDLTLDNSNFAGANSSGTIQIGKLNSPIGNKYIFGSNADFDYVFEIGVGTSSTDESTFGYAIRGSANGAHNVTIKKVGDGTQIFNRNGYGFMYNNHEYAMDSLKEVIVDGGKMIIDATSGNSEFAYNKAVGYWGTAPITVNSGATLEYKQPWTVAPNSDMTINGGTLTLDNTQYINKLTLNSGTINGAGNVQAGYHGNADWNVKGGVTTINNNVVLVKNDSSTTFTINFDKDATLIIAKDVYSHSTLSGMELIFKGTGDGPGNVNLTSTAAMTKVGNITFNNMNGTIASAITGESAVTKTGAGTVTLTGANDYTGATTVSGGTLVLASSGTLASNVTVGSGAEFVDGASSITSNVTINGGTFTIGDTSAASRISIGDFALTDGTVNFDFNSASTADNYDFLTTGAATLTSGTINVSFNSGDVDTWWSNCSDSGYALISASSLTPGDFQLLVNSAQSQQWYLDTTGNTLVLKKQGSEPPTDKYYRANSQEALAEDTWTIDGTNKEGIKFTEGDKTTETYTGGVEMNVSGSVEVAQDKNLTLSGVVSGEGAMDKTGKGTLTLSGDNTYSGDTTVSEGKLTLSGAAIKANGPIDIAADATLEYNVPTGEKSLEFTNSNAVTGSNAIKTGAGTLKILSTDGLFAPDNFAVEAGELDFKGKYNGDLIVKTGSTLSPGNSVGDLTVYGNVKIDAGATGLFEFSAYNEDPTQQQFDTLTVNDGAFVIDENSIIKLFFEGGNEDARLWAAEGEEYKLVYDNEFNSDVLPKLGNYQGWFDLVGRTDGLYLVGLGAPESTGVPEPSTWALLILGVAGLMYVRKRKN